MNIVYIENNFANLALIERVANLWHHTVINFTSAENALESLANLDSSLLLVDIKLDGEMDGVDFIKTIRAKGITIPIVAMTAYDTSEQKERCYTAGCNVYLTKPISILDLKRIIEKFT